MNAPRHFSELARRSGNPPISWLMKLALEQPSLISLAAGFTDNETLPVKEVASLCRELFRQPVRAHAALQYGMTSGLPELRRQIVRRFHQQDGTEQPRLAPEDVVVTNGSQQLLYLITEALCDPGDIVVVEDPTYFVYLGILEAMGARAAGFVGLTGLAMRLERLKRDRLLPRVKLIYTQTYFQNPTGRTWTLDMKREVLGIVKHYEKVAGHPIYLIEDAAYRDMRFGGDDVPSIKQFDPRNERVLYSSTLTKPFATGFKVGYGILPPVLMRSVLRSKGNHDFGTSNFLQTVLARALGEGVYQQHLPALRAAYRGKCTAMLTALARHFPATARYERPHGGMYVWVELDAKTRTGVRNRVFHRALRAGVLYVPGELCYGNDPTRSIPKNFMRLSFGAQSTRAITTGVRLLAGVLG